MGGLGLDQSSLRRYNAAYRAVPARSGQRGQPKLTIPIPLGLIQFFHDHPLSNIKNDPAFNHDSAGFNPVELLKDRKSTRLNSSHGYISYAVFCLKKKKTYLHPPDYLDRS